MDPAIAAGVVRALYVAILEREPDADGLAHQARRLVSGIPLEQLMAELAQARDIEQPAGFERAVPAVGEDEMARLRDLQGAQRRTLLALSRRLAVLEDRLLSRQEDAPDAGRAP